MEYVEYGIAILLAGVIYALVDKVIAPLVTNKSGKNGVGKQEYINHRTEQRLDKNDRDIEGLNATMSDVRVKAEGLKEILKRVEAAVRIREN